MSKKQKIIVALVAALIAFAVVYSFAQRNSLRKKRASQVMTENHQNQGVSESNVLNNDNVSPITGLPCDNWNRRPIAVMQPSDFAARPASGFSEADMVIEMPVITATITRLMGVYICNNPESVGSMRSARHDFVSLAKGMDAIFVHWGRSHMDWFIEKLDNGIIDNINCNDDAGKSAGRYCFRHPDLVGMHSGYMKFDKILEAANDFGYRLETDFEGYPHKSESSLEERPQGGNLRVAYAGNSAVEYDYDRETNSYIRTWGGVLDKDRNNNEKIAPKNVVVAMAKSEQIEGQYNNVELGDPWMDTLDSGEAYYYMDGKEYRGNWKKDKSSVGSKLTFYDKNGEEIKFVPGQVWVNILEPGQRLRWTPVN